MSDFLERIAKLPPDRLALLAAELKDRLDQAEGTAARDQEPIAVIGTGCRLPGGCDGPDSYWRFLRDGKDGVREVPAERWDADRLRDADPDVPGKMVTCRGGFLDDVEHFDARFFGIAPREAVSVDPQHRLLLEVAWEALENAGLAGDALTAVPGGVFVGLCGHEYFELMLEHPLEEIDSYYASGVAGSMAAGRIAYLLGLSGPALTVDTACSSSLVAVHLACESLRRDECGFAIAGGANLLLGVETMITLSKARMLSPDGRCSTFDESANGIVRGEGCGVVVLKRLSDAQADGDTIHALIRATAINQDGRSSGITAPNGSAQEALMRLALERAHLSAGDVDYVEAHGTGTRLGDPIEVRALGAVYGQRDAESPLRIGSVKTNFGHLEAAAGVAGLLKVILALQHRQIPPHRNLRRRNPLIEWEQWPIDVPTTLTPWEEPARGGPRRAAVSSFGFSGTNAHLILEQAPAPPEVDEAGGDDGIRLLSLSARTPTALKTLAQRYADALEGGIPGSGTFRDVCKTAAMGRARFQERLCVTAATGDEAAVHLRDWLAGQRTRAVLAGRATGSREPVFLFTGQGAQYPHMGRDLLDSSEVFRDAFLRCEQALESLLETPLREVLYPVGEDQVGRAEILLQQTAYAQPALYAVEYALAELWRSRGIEPAAVAGHSVGEFVAATVAGMLTPADALTLVATRGRLMQKVADGGGMAAVMADAATVEAALANHPAVCIAAFNAPENTVISGPHEPLEAVLGHLSGNGVEVRRLPVAGAFHSVMMEPVLDDFERVLAGVRIGVPEIPIVSTCTGELMDDGAWASPAYWRRQMRQPVRFADAVRCLRREGFDTFLEIGPRPTLCGLGQATLGDDGSLFVPSLRQGQSESRELVRGLAALHVNGIEPDWNALLGEQPGRRVALPSYPFERSRYWLGWSRRACGETAGTAAAQSRDEGDGLLWLRRWIDDPGGSGVMDPEAVVAVLDDRVAGLVEAHGGAIYRDFLPRLDALCTVYVVQALREMGLKLIPGETLEEGDLRDRLGVLPEHRRLFHRLLEILAEDGLVSAAGAKTWQVERVPEAAEVGAMLDALCTDFPACRVEAEMTARCAGGLAGALQGKTDPMELLFPEGSLEPTERLYADTPSFRVFNGLAAEAVAALARAAQGTGRSLRILEIGGGTGGTTSRLLPLLRDLEVNYLFTDVSPLFLERARDKFQAYDFLEYRLLDVTADPGGQGVTPASFDVVLASNVLHATPDLAETLARVNDLLVPGGTLVLLEGLRPQRFGDLTVGLTDGWWSFTDTRRRPGYALMDRKGWLELLQDGGFDTAVLPRAEAGDGGLLDQQGVILARRGNRTPIADSRNGRSWLAVVRKGGESERLALGLRKRGLAVRTIDALAVSGAQPEAGEAYAGALASLGSEDGPGGLLHLLSVDETSAPDDDATTAMARQQRSIGSALGLVRAAVDAGNVELIFLTRLAQATDGEAVDPVGAPLWGVARTVAVEHPDLPCRAVDLPADWESELDALADLLRGGAPVTENEVALRSGRRLVARVTRQAVGQAAVAPDPEGSYIVTGGLSGLGLAVARWLAQGGAGRLVLCGRSAPGPETRDLVDQLQQTGVDVRLVRGDVGDGDCVAALMDAAESSRLRGVFHCAGVTADATLLHQSWGQMAEVMNAKVAGAWNLHRATCDCRLDHFVLFSTGAAFLGTAGQANHAAANAYLAGLALHRRAAGLPGLAIDWGAWSEIGAATRGDVIRRARAVGMDTIDPRRGLNLLGRLMAGDCSHVAALAIDWDVFLSRYPVLAARGAFSSLLTRRSGAPAGEAVAPERAEVSAEQAAAGELSRDVLSASAGSRRQVLFDGLHRAAARALGLPPGESIDPGLPLTELGLDSLMAVELRNALGTQLGRSLPATLLFTYPTLEELTGHLLSGFGMPSEEEDDKLRPPSPSVDALDEDELAELLERKLKLPGVEKQ
ncbi:type I polyketide synthase [Methylonatrum kenyense]|uniref:type I polyketide synthase n=1 Tax=Methylonatrum kenyense TaxID=455253 RepID=UPI0020C119F2|nr:type I polyketide synthase [Methylonatrum kenyense]MCK8516799.1 type I polyketide synthase [Methylonatrum kenyense]